MHRVFPPSKPPDGGYPPSFCLVVGGTQLRGSWYLSAIVRLQGFSSCSPVAPLHRWSLKTVTTSPWVGRRKPGCDLGPTLSFKDAHHPRWGGGRAEPELYLHTGSWVSLSLSVRGRERSLALRERGTSTTRGWLTAGVVSFSALGLAPGAPSCRKGGYRAVRTGGPPKTSRAARAAFVFWGGPAFAPIRRLCAEVGAPLVREDPSGDLPAG
jgi:hypothetical protein